MSMCAQRDFPICSHAQVVYLILVFTLSLALRTLTGLMGLHKWSGEDSIAWWTTYVTVAFALVSRWMIQPFASGVHDCQSYIYVLVLCGGTLWAVCNCACTAVPLAACASCLAHYGAGRLFGRNFISPWVHSIFAPTQAVPGATKFAAPNYVARKQSPLKVSVSILRHRLCALTKPFHHQALGRKVGFLMSVTILLARPAPFLSLNRVHAGGQSACWLPPGALWGMALLQAIRSEG